MSMVVVHMKYAHAVGSSLVLMMSQKEFHIWNTEKNGLLEDSTGLGRMKNQLTGTDS